MTFRNLTVYFDFKKCFKIYWTKFRFFTRIFGFNTDSSGIEEVVLLSGEVWEQYRVKIFNGRGTKNASLLGYSVGF